MERKWTGPLGEAVWIENMQEIDTRLAVWILTIPGANSFWSQYILSVVHLRNSDGYAPANKQYPEAGYELIVAAVDPAVWIENLQKLESSLKILHPLNVVVQFHGVDDEGAREVASACAKACVNGRLFVEPSGIRGARELWDEGICIHIQHCMKG